MANVLTLTTPLMRHTVGFDRFNDLFESLLEDKSRSVDNYPPYNIEKHGEDAYRIVMAVAGFQMEDLEIILQDGTLNIKGHDQDRLINTDAEILHKGIASRSFERSFQLADFIKVQDAELSDGLLTIHLKREIPEEKKPRTISIKGPKVLLSGKVKKK